MSESKHTKGPWAVLVGKYGLQIHSQSFGSTHWIANIKCESCPAHEDANARLIAAAPEMYEALPDLSCVITWLENGCDPLKARDELAIYKARIDAAKAKAESRS